MNKSTILKGACLVGAILIVSIFFKEKIETIETHERTIQKQTLEIQALSSKLTKSKQDIKIVEITRKDGTKIKTTRIIKTKQTKQTNEKTTSKVSHTDIKKDMAKKTHTNPKRLVLRLEANYIDSSIYGQFGGTYSIFGPVGVSASVFKQINGSNVGGGVGVSYGF